MPSHKLPAVPVTVPDELAWARETPEAMPLPIVRVGGWYGLRNHEGEIVALVSDPTTAVILSSATTALYACSFAQSVLNSLGPMELSEQMSTTMCAWAVSLSQRELPSEAFARPEEEVQQGRAEVAHA
ncbi:hypothetical protein [Longimicrobium sp.]|jgi:hypothetical protein|uniref:hypothetical protein n=1 Tax=Longimicrobium sp. TaxID=2029185 RepID=UPI002EDA1B41